MYWARLCFLLACVCMLVSTLTAQKAPRKSPARIPDYSVGTFDEHLKYARTGNVTASTTNAATYPQIDSIPHWQGKFTAVDGSVYPFIMAGSDPSHNVTTTINTAIIAVSLSFDEYADPYGNNLLLSAQPVIKPAMTSPEFERAAYSTGYTQFTDAVQLAEFHKWDQGHWHTLLAAPRVLTPVTVEVPAGLAQVFVTDSGKVFAKVDAGFLFSQVNTIAQLEGLRVDEVPILLTSNVLLYEGGDPRNCCVFGFHTAFETPASASTRSIQTLIYATWLDQGIFKDSDVADVISLSHELSELVNDPFVTNQAPPWEYPDGSTCQADLEVGDPIEVLPHPASEVTLHGFTYHPQTEALLQWFTQRPHSDAFDNAFSFPDTRELSHSAVPCKN